jgi:hypothetical protein
MTPEQAASPTSGGPSTAEGAGGGNTVHGDVNGVHIGTINHYGDGDDLGKSIASHNMIANTTAGQFAT